VRPLKLTIQAFGSYGKEATVNFQEPNQNLFLITGDTGAGKTTIFDAMVFALYGEASSGANKKDGMELQSHFAGIDVEPFVEFVFSDGAGPACNIYTIRRVPEHQRPLKRGKGVKKESGSVSLVMPDKTQYPQKETNQKIEEIVGLTKAQFMQVAMIAQGEFMELLRARSDDKKVIFRKLFNTGLFQGIVEELGRRKKEKEKEIAAIRTICQTEAAHVLVPEGYGRAAEMDLLKERIATSARLAIPDMEQLLKELEGLCAWLKAGRDVAKEEYKKAGRLRDEKRDNYVDAGSLLKFFKQKEDAENTLEECLGQEAQVEELGILITQLRAAYEIQAEFKRYDAACKLADRTRLSLEEQKKALPGLLKRAQEAAGKEQEANRAFEEELEAYSKTSERVDKALKLFREIDRAKEDAAKKEKALQEAETAAGKEQEKLAVLEEKERLWRDQAQRLEGAKEALARWESRAHEVSGLAEELQGACQLADAVRKQRAKARNTRQAYLSATEMYEKKNYEYEGIRKAFLDGQAGFLARELEPGKPCPVCGSTEHPRPCRQAREYGELSREAVEELGKAVNDLRLCQEKLSGDANSDAVLLAEKEQTLKGSSEKLYERMRRSIGGTMPEDAALGQMTLEQAGKLVTDWGESVKEEGEKRKRDVAMLNKVQKSLDGIDGKKEALGQTARQARERAAQANASLTGSRSVLASLEKARDYPTAEEAGRVKKEAGKRRDQKEADYKKAQEEARRAKTAKENAKTLIAEYARMLPEQEKEAGERKAAYEAMMEQKNLPRAEWKKLAGNYGRTAPDELQKKVNRHYEKKAAARSLKKSAEEAIHNRKRPDLEKALQERDEAEKAWKAADIRLKQYDADYRANVRAYDGLAPKMEERKKAVAEHTKLDTLYRLVSGNVTGSRMDLETFVQRYYLEKILYRANRRFREMSAGQFELRMYDLEKAGEGKNKGLDLMVYSAVTGKEREIRTLSGGESFMAALSLALGMADQIKESSAAINLDMMFIDEGFGSLDEYSRNQAVKVLQTLAGGSRLIGIISHVTELKHEIEDQLVVTKDQGGSHVKWQIS